MNVESGELVVSDVRPFPKLTDGSPLLQQVRRGGRDSCLLLLLLLFGLRMLLHRSNHTRLSQTVAVS